MKPLWVFCVFVAVVLSSSDAADEELLKADTILSKYYSNYELVRLHERGVNRIHVAMKTCKHLLLAQTTFLQAYNQQCSNISRVFRSMLSIYISSGCLDAAVWKLPCVPIAMSPVVPVQGVRWLLPLRLPDITLGNPQRWQERLGQPFASAGDLGPCWQGRGKAQLQVHWQHTWRRAIRQVGTQLSCGACPLQC